MNQENNLINSNCVDSVLTGVCRCDNSCGKNPIGKLTNEPEIGKMAKKLKKLSNITCSMDGIVPNYNMGLSPHQTNIQVARKSFSLISESVAVCVDNNHDITTIVRLKKLK